MSFFLFGFDSTFEISHESTHLSIPRWQTSIAVIPLEANRLLLDIHEDDQTYRIFAELPGAREEKVIVRVSQCDLEIEADIPAPTVSNKKNEVILLQERCYGHFHRKIHLRQSIDDSKAEARYRDGILTVLLPKKKTISDEIITVKTGT